MPEDDDLSPEELAEISSAMGHEKASVVSSEEHVHESKGSQISSAQFMQLEEAAEVANLPAAELERMHNVRIHVEVILGTTRMPLERILELHEGSVVELNKLAGEPVDIVANGKLMARGEIVVVDENFGVKILEIAGMDQKVGALG
jgi:flagellar motor switch protein FliN/FliY